MKPDRAHATLLIDIVNHAVDLEILWTVATERMPELHRYLSPLVPIRLPNSD